LPRLPVIFKKNGRECVRCFSIISQAVMDAEAPMSSVSFPIDTFSPAGASLKYLSISFAFGF